VNLLDRYIFKSVLFTCMAAVGLLSFVLLVGNAMKQLIGYMLAGQIDPLTFARLLGLLLPFVITFALPMGVLTGVLLTLGRLSADSEITAMRSSGIGLWRVARPVFILAMLGMVFALFINHFTMPLARVQYNKELTDAIRSNPLSFIVPRTFIREFPGVVVYVGEKNGAELGDFWLWQLDKERRVVRQVRAAQGNITYDEDGNALVLTLRKARIELMPEKTDLSPSGKKEAELRSPEDFREAQLVGNFEETEAVRLPLDSMYSRDGVRTKLDFLPWNELHEERVRLDSPALHETPAQKYDRERRATKIDLVVSERYNNALAVLSFALIGVPLGIRVSRRETSANLGIAIALALSYYVMTTAIGWLEKAPQWQPELLLYLPNLLFVVLAAWLFKRVENH
jgi:lipopolysaccharide export system permease protein